MLFWGVITVFVLRREPFPLVLPFNTDTDILNNQTIILPTKMIWMGEMFNMTFLLDVLPNFQNMFVGYGVL